MTPPGCLHDALTLPPTSSARIRTPTSARSLPPTSYHFRGPYRTPGARGHALQQAMRKQKPIHEKTRGTQRRGSKGPRGNVLKRHAADESLWIGAQC